MSLEAWWNEMGSAKQIHHCTARFPLLHIKGQYNITYNSSITKAEHKSEFQSPYRKAMGCLCEYFGENRLYYNETALQHNNHYINGLLQERHNSSGLAMEVRLFLH